jgi:hypothetical protein
MYSTFMRILQPSQCYIFGAESEELKSNINLYQVKVSILNIEDKTPATLSHNLRISQSV